MPTGSTLEATDELVVKIEESLEDLKEKQDLVSNIEEEEARITVLLQEDYQDIDNRTFGAILNDVREKMNALESNAISLKEPTNSPGSRGGGGGGGTEGFAALMGIGEDEEYTSLLY